jgi:hypothetical protein
MSVTGQREPVVKGAPCALAEAWVTASQGAVSAAVTIMLSAAETGTNGQFAAEVLCLQAVTQFGEGGPMVASGALVAEEEGPRPIRHPG